MTSQRVVAETGLGPGPPDSGPEFFPYELLPSQKHLGKWWELGGSQALVHAKDREAEPLALKEACKLSGSFGVAGVPHCSKGSK